MLLPQWNLNEFYQSFKDENINKDILKLKKKINSFSKKYRGKLQSFGEKNLFKSLEEFEHIEELSQKYEVSHFSLIVQIKQIKKKLNFISILKKLY